jgi:bifunctional UDP-N-acetylglucosamine pyrophosphorylase/glucosamine-1-phosphate N-acetyltransferase
MFEVQGINSMYQLNKLERHYQRQKAIELMEMGVTLADINRIDIRGKLNICGTDIFIDVNNVFEGDVTLGNNVHIGPNCVIQNANIGDNVTIKANSVLEDCSVGSDSTVGPFARLRPGAKLDTGVHIGNFVEVKKSTIGEGSKINHLSYVGDAEIGSKVNVGAGTITCNYDGVNKHKTTIKDGVFIGSGTQLVAPVTIGEDATLGAGTTLSKDAPDGALTVTRTKQVSLKGWKKPTKE